MKHIRTRSISRGVGANQRGVVLLFALIALLVLMIGAAALVRSFNTSLFNAGNTAFKKDLQNQGERAVVAAMTAMRSGALMTDTARGNNNSAQNYSAVMLPVNNQGIPLALLTSAAFAGVGTASNDIVLTDQQVEIRYVVDRMCSATGAHAALGPSACMLADNPVPSGGSADNFKRPEDPGTGMSAVPQQVIYRVSVRAKGPRNTQAYFQSTFTM